MFFGKSTGGGILGVYLLKKERERERQMEKEKLTIFNPIYVFVFVFFLASHLKLGNIVIPFLI